jgi:hypothetical protein
LIRTNSFDMLDADFKVGTLAERTSKQPGRARHTTTTSSILSLARQLLM